MRKWRGGREENNDELVYDNKVGETDDNADPTTAISGGSIVIHSKGIAKNQPDEESLPLENEVSIPTDYVLSQNFPNPFNPTTEIQFQLPEENHVTLTIFNSLGNEIARLIDAHVDAGTHTVQWNAKDVNGIQLPSGIYFYRIQAGNFVQVKKMNLTK